MELSAHQRDHLISSEEAARRINNTGWVVSGGHHFHAHAWATPTAETLADGSLRVCLNGMTTLDLPGDRIVALHPWRIEIIHVHLFRKDRKKRDGGGQHDVPQLGTLIAFRNPALDPEATAR
ncbi:hypothetical protein EBS80_01275 [bacterium]|nr:hypothetical protein [bacterium]